MNQSLNHRLELGWNPGRASVPKLYRSKYHNWSCNSRSKCSTCKMRSTATAKTVLEFILTRETQNWTRDFRLLPQSEIRDRLDPHLPLWISPAPKAIVTVEVAKVGLRTRIQSPPVHSSLSTQTVSNRLVRRNSGDLVKIVRKPWIPNKPAAVVKAKISDSRHRCQKKEVRETR